LKTLRIPDDVHHKLTALLGELVAQSGKMQTYADAIQTLLRSSVVLPDELMAQVENFIENRKDLGYTTREDFIRDAVRHRLEILSGEFEYVMIPKEDCELLERAIEEMEAPFRNAADFIRKQIEDTLEKYKEWKKSTTKA